MLKIQLNNSNHRRIEFTEKSSHSLNKIVELAKHYQSFYFLNLLF